MPELRVDLQRIAPFISETDLLKNETATMKAYEKLNNKSGAGSDYVGWVDLPFAYDKTEFAKIKETAAVIREKYDALVVVGIGGSYLGARAVIEALNRLFHNESTVAGKAPNIYYLGCNISSTYAADLLDVLENKNFAINVISKSGTTTEPAIAFRLLKELLQKKYGEAEAQKRIFITTDAHKGALKELADAEGYPRFVVPDDVGGRYSVLTAVGLLPIAVAGIDIDELMSGAAAMAERCRDAEFSENPALQYAACRNLLYRKGKKIELLVNYEPCLHYFAEWWKQLFGESEGKDNTGLFPAAVDFSTDLHSMGQYIQEGERILCETVLWVNNVAWKVKIPNDAQNVDGLNFLSGKGMDFVNEKAFQGTILAHVDGGVPNIVVEIPELTPYYLGQAIYFFELSCGISGYLNEINPFDQPGVEAYKRNMFALLGKPGYEAEKKELELKLNS